MRSIVAGLHVSLLVLILIGSLIGSADAQVRTIGQPNAFPIEIKGRGSYRLIGNLKVLSPDRTAIEISAVGPVTIDLNGFSILGPVACAGSPTTCVPSGSGVGIKGSAHSIVSVFNGTVTGMGGVGISLGAMARIRDVSATGNGGGGISVGANSVVSGASASDNGGDGIATGAYSVVSGCSASNNGGNGINGAPGVAVSATTTGANKDAGIVAETVTGSSADGDGNAGILAATVAASTANSNTLTGIMAATVTGSTMEFNQGDGFGGNLVVNSSSSANAGYGIGNSADFAFDLFSTNTAGSLKAAGNQLGTSDCNGTVPCP
ncbi:MAG TPA: hypothetical protein VNE82_24765 [Candidatus Binataceae bacterium]|nr:hypothetical protein [Candidatus Binataceae bacterium]